MNHDKSFSPNKKRLFRLGMLLAAAVLLALGGITAARYVQQHRQDGVASAKEFYFTSNYLKESKENATYFIDPKIGSFQIALYNTEDLQRQTAKDIRYTVTAEGAGVEDSANGTLTGEQQSMALLTVSPTVAEGKVTVTAKAFSPYQKELTATFELALGNQYQVEDETGNTAAVLTVTCTDDGGSISIILPDGVVPDATDGRVDSESGEYKFTAPGPGVYSLVLLKTNKNVDLSCDSTAFANQISLQK